MGGGHGQDDGAEDGLRGGGVPGTPAAPAATLAPRLDAYAGQLSNHRDPGQSRGHSVYNRFHWGGQVFIRGMSYTESMHARMKYLAMLVLAPALLLPACDEDMGPALRDSGITVSDLGLMDSNPGPDTAPPTDGAMPDSLTCAAPIPFKAPGKPAGWRHTSTGLLVVTQGPANHRAQDVVVTTSAASVLIGKFADGPLDKDLKGEDVEVYLQQVPPCGPWVSLGVVVTSQDGQHGTKGYGVTDDGGRVFFTMAQVPPVARYPVRMLVRGDHSMARMTLFVVKSQTPAVVFDIDGTLTTDDFQLVHQLFSKLLNGSYTPKAYTGAANLPRTCVALLVIFLSHFLLSSSPSLQGGGSGVPDGASALKPGIKPEGQHGLELRRIHDLRGGRVIAVGGLSPGLRDLRGDDLLWPLEFDCADWLSV